MRAEIDTGWMAFEGQRVCYVIQPAVGGPFKVGHAVSVAKRMPDIQAGNPLSLRVRALFSGGQKTESILHRRLADYRLFGEWFDPRSLGSLFEFMQGNELLLWGNPWTDCVYDSPVPLVADIRAKMRAVLISPKVLATLEELVTDTKHPSHKETLRILADMAEIGLARKLWNAER